MKEKYKTKLSKKMNRTLLNRQDYLKLMSFFYVLYASMDYQPEMFMNLQPNRFKNIKGKKGQNN